jgi:Acetoacetate decarboxylase (ADC)
VLTGTADVDALAARAPVMGTFDAGPLELSDVEVLQAAFELPYACREPLLPPGLHPTTPPLLIVLAWRVGSSPWGPFSLAQARISCRSGVRPRGFVAACIVDRPDAAHALGTGWGLPAVAGDVELRRGYDRVELSAGRGGAPALELVGLDPDPMDVGDVQFTVTSSLAHTPRGLRLVQIEPEYALRRVERVRPHLAAFDGAAWELAGVVPHYPVAATVARGEVTVPPLRFVSRPDVNAFEGTERI